jgi:hypothetical protein
MLLNTRDYEPNFHTILHLKRNFMSSFITIKIISLLRWFHYHKLGTVYVSVPGIWVAPEEKK